ncbi:hypothetical protein EDD85DRAFT_792543 [Armillaria nabsnona]|nr:hypothetical protein EDD85DRAFT_792543 [Armillaria nabsnona]
MPEGLKTDFAAVFLNHCSQTTLKNRVMLGIYSDIKKPVSPKKNKKCWHTQDPDRRSLKQTSLDSYFSKSNDKQGDNQGLSSLEDFLKAATVVKLHHNTLILMGTSATRTHKNIWLDPKLRPNLHTSINLYTRKVWDQQIVPLPAAGRGFCIGIVFDFGDYILLFNSRDCPFEISWRKCKKNLFPSPLSLPYSTTGTILDHPADNETLLQAYHLWLSSTVRFSGKHWLSMEPVWVAIQNDHAAFDTFGMYATSILCFLAGSCSMPFENGVPLYRLKRALSYDHIGLCATLEDQISYKEDLYVYRNEKCSISIIADRAFNVWVIEQSQGNIPKFDVFHL